MEQNLQLPNRTEGLVPQDGAVWRGATHWSYKETNSWDVNTFSDEFQRPLHIYRTFKWKGCSGWTDSEKEFINKGGIIFFSFQSNNWKEDATKKNDWNLKQLAKTICEIKPAKLFVAPGYEPDGHCAPYAKDKETFGTPEEYVAYRNYVKKVFDAEGCDNVIYVMDLSNKCASDPEKTGSLIPRLFPKDGSVQYLFWNLFQMSDEENYQMRISKGQKMIHWDSKANFDWFYDYFSDESNPNYDLWKDIPWGIGAWGSNQMIWKKTRDLKPEERRLYINNVTEAIENHEKYPKIKASIWFNSLESIITKEDPTEIKFYADNYPDTKLELGSSHLMGTILNYLHNSKFDKADQHYGQHDIHKS